ncbi:hypothetical protein HBI09_163160 [Parastagonospora nodorum]|nr:hypothetical protein HBI09_163160 [Parastagonospora nodorum]KAH5005762.1 hypothetical protein HBI77_116550 [Parastagonospora nodorum]
MACLLCTTRRSETFCVLPHSNASPQHLVLSYGIEHKSRLRFLRHGVPILLGSSFICFPSSHGIFNPTPSGSHCHEVYDPHKRHIPFSLCMVLGRRQFLMFFLIYA